MGVEEINEKWNIESPDQVIDILGLMGDASDNIPGVPGVGEKTAQKLIAQYGSMEGLYENVDKLKGKQKEKIEANKEQAFLSKKLVVINLEVPVTESMDDFKILDPDKKALEPIFVEFELNSLGKRVIADDFKAGRGHQSSGSPRARTDGPAQRPRIHHRRKPEAPLYAGRHLGETR